MSSRRSYYTHSTSKMTYCTCTSNKPLMTATGQEYWSHIAASFAVHGPQCVGIAVDRECMFRDYCISQKRSVASTHHSFSQHVQLMAVHTVRQVCSGCTADTCFNRLMLVIWEHNHGASYDFWSKAHGSETTKILNKLQDLRNNGSSDPGTFPSSAKVYLGFVLIHLPTTHHCNLTALQCRQHSSSTSHCCLDHP